MSVSLPYPDKPANGQAPDADPIRLNIQALLQAIQAFDGSQIIAKSVVEGALADAINPRLRDGAWMSNWIESGGYTSAFTNLTWTMPSGYAWLNGYRSMFTGQSYTVGANQDTYYSVTQAGALNAPIAVANGATQPTLPGGSQWLAKVISGATAITSIVDLRTLTPLNVSPLIKSITNTGSAGGTIYYLNLGGLKIAFSNGTTILSSGANSAINAVFNLPSNFFTTVYTVIPSLQASTSTQVTANINGFSSAVIQIYVVNMSTTTAGGAPCFIAIGV